MTPVIVDRIPIMPLGMVNAFIVRGTAGAILVDAGLPRSENRVAAALKRVGLGFADLKLIVITHGHIDHAGNAARLRELSGAPILLHADEARYCAREQEMTFCPTGPFGRLFLRTGVVQRPYPGFVADIVVAGTDTFDLRPYGITGSVQATPGHTQGSVSVVLDQGNALVGDLVASGILLGGIALTGLPKRPPFEENPGQTAQALTRLLDAGATRFHLGHGGPLPAQAVARHAHRLSKLG